MHRRNFLALAGAATVATTLSRSAWANVTDDLVEIDLTQQGFSRRTVQTPIGAMAVHEAGQGEPLLLVHGVGAGASSFIWYRIATQLAKRFRVIAPDLVGWGASERPAKNLLFDDYVTQIRSLGDLIAAPSRVVASSLACGFTIEAIDQGFLPVEKLALLSPSGGLDFGIDTTPPQALARFREIIDTPAQEEFYARIFHQRPAVENWYRAIGFADPEAVPEELILANMYYARRPNASFSALPFLAGSLRFDIAPYLQKVPEKTLMIWGEDEIQIPRSAQDRIENANPAIDTVRIGGARSVFVVEQPEATLAALERFLN